MKKIKENKKLVKIIKFITYFLEAYCIFLMVLGVVALFFIKPLYIFINNHPLYFIIPIFSLIFLIPFNAEIHLDHRKKTIDYNLKFDNFNDFIMDIDSRINKLKIIKHCNDDDKVIYYGFSPDKVILKYYVFFKFGVINKTSEEIEEMISKTVDDFFSEMKNKNEKIGSWTNMYYYTFCFWVDRENAFFHEIVESYFYNKHLKEYTLSAGISQKKKKIYIFNPITQYDKAIYRNFCKLLNLKK